MPIEAKVTGASQITATVGESVIDVSVGGGVGPTGSQGSSGVVSVSAPLVNGGSASAAQLSLSVGSGLQVSGGSLALASHTHTASQITDFNAAVVAAAPPTTNASLLTSGTLPDARLSANIARTSDITSAVNSLVDSAPGALDTLNELAAALGDDANFASTVTNALAGKAASVHTHAASDIVSGTLSASRLPIASSGSLGGVRIGSGISIDGSGVISASSGYTLPTASANTLGGVKIGSGITITDGVISVSSASVAWNDITGKPSTFAPSAHAASHAVGGADGLTPADIGAALAADFDQGVKTSDSPEFIAVTAGTVTVLGAGPGNQLIIEDGASVLFASGVSGAILSWDNDGYVVALPNGTSGQVLVSSSSAYGWATLTAADVGAAAAYHTHSAADITSGTLSASRLPNTTVTAASYGSASSVATFTVDATGRLTAAGSTSIAIAAGAVSGLATIATSGSASDLGSGTVPVGRLGSSGTASSSTFLRGDNTWATAGSNSASDLTTGTLAAARIGAHASTHQTGGSDAVTNVVVSPSQITGNQNDYSPGTGDIVRLSSDADRNITGITAGASGDVRVLVNVGSFTITLVHQSTSSTAANRFLVSFGADYLLAANAAAVIVYDGTTSRWRVI